MKRIYAAYTHFTGLDIKEMSVADGHTYVRNDIPGPRWLYSHYIPETKEYVYDAVVEDNQVPNHPRIMLVEDI